MTDSFFIASKWLHPCFHHFLRRIHHRLQSSSICSRFPVEKVPSRFYYSGI